MKAISTPLINDNGVLLWHSRVTLSEAFDFNLFFSSGLSESLLASTQDYKLTEVSIFSCLEMFFTAYVLCSLRLLIFKTNGEITKLKSKF